MEYEEISLKELIIILIKGWKWIVSLTLITTLAAIVFTLGFKPVLYESNSSFNIILPSSVETQFGTYNFPSTNVNDYIVNLKDNEVLKSVIDNAELNMSVEELSTLVNYSYDPNKGINLVNTSVKSSDPKLSVQIHQIWLDEFVQYLDKKYQEIARNQLMQNIDNKEITLKNESGSILIQLEAIENYSLNVNYNDGTNINESSENYLYYQLISKRMNLELRNTEIDLLLKQLDDLKTNLKNQGDLSLLEDVILLPNQINELTKPLSRGVLINSAVGFVMGLLISSFILFLREFWRNHN